MAIKRPRSANPTQARDKTGGSILMSPSSSSSTASENRREPKRTKKTPRRNTSATSSSSDEDEEEVGNPTDWNQKEGSSIQKKKNLTLAEHAKRRLSGKLGLARRSMNFDQPPSAHSSPARAPGNGRVGALARARENHAKARQSIGVAQDNPLVISTEVMNNNYDEWMKMATDNKINVNNTWSFALIDYFHDMSLLRNPEAEGGINFQKASCTLDGCVKIWTSRVDSVATETGKLLSGLAEEANNISNQIDGEDDEDAGEESGLKAPKKTRTRATNSTSLVEFNEKLKLKNSNLSSRSTLYSKRHVPTLTKVDPVEFSEEERPILLDVSKLKSAFLDSVEGFQARSICPCLSNFKFSTTDTIQSFESLAALANMPEKLDDLAVTHDAHDTGNDFFDSNESPNLGEDNFQMPDQEDVDDEE
ncbi:hypothetical protein H4Q26_008375 [Puccinia striiformis f. sp. tritici PST-130]|nr:hypothetical protein H4Q26_008375 [Puccinia striiformis f. sp. tritici PST-130]